MPMNRAYRLHVDACNDVLSLMLAGSIVTRSETVERLSEAYRKRGIGPIRGWTSKNLYDKELAMVYIVGKYGLGIEIDEHQTLSQIFSLEIKCEKILQKLLNGSKPSDAIREVAGDVSKNTIFRVLRLLLTAVVLGFEDEEKLLKIHKALAEEFKEYERGFRSFIKFYIALRIAEKIALRKVKSRNEKEALKLSMCLRTKAERMAPSDELISLIAKEVFGVPKRIVERVLRGVE
ncbi:MAG: DUF2192 domain-containing protein [Candidatus Nezhaarchaeales archaeon]